MTNTVPLKESCIRDPLRERRCVLDWEEWIVTPMYYERRHVDLGKAIEARGELCEPRLMAADVCSALDVLTRELASSMFVKGESRTS